MAVTPKNGIITIATTTMVIREGTNRREIEAEEAVATDMGEEVVVVMNMDHMDTVNIISLRMHMEEDIPMRHSTNNGTHNKDITADTININNRLRNTITTNIRAIHHNNRITHSKDTRSINSSSIISSQTPKRTNRQNHHHIRGNGDR